MGGRLIDADKLLELIGDDIATLNFIDMPREGYDVCLCTLQMVKQYINALPTIEAELIKHGRWIKNEDRSGWHCSCCGKDDLYAYPYAENNERELQDFYCPNCGARMFDNDIDVPDKNVGKMDEVTE